MKRPLLLIAVASGLALGLPPTAASAETLYMFDSLEISAQVSVPPDDGMPATVELRAKFLPTDVAGGIPPDDGLEVRFQPPDPVMPAWSVSFPAGCFQPHGRRWAVQDWQECGASVRLVDDSGLEVDLSPYLLSLNARMAIPPDDGMPWELRMDLEALGLPPEALPPDPIRGATSLFVGQSAGTVPASVVSWKGAAP